MLTTAWPSAEVPPRTTIVCPDRASRLWRRNVHAVAYDSGMAARSVHELDDSKGTTFKLGARTYSA